MQFKVNVFKTNYSFESCLKVRKNNFLLFLNMYSGTCVRSPILFVSFQSSKSKFNECTTVYFLTSKSFSVLRIRRSKGNVFYDVPV